MPAATSVRPAAAAPTAGLTSWARITEAISRTNHPNMVAQCGRVDECDEASADQGAGDGGGGDESRQAPVDLLGGEVPGEAGEGLHRDDDQRGAHRDGHRQSGQQRQCRYQQEAAAGADEPADHADGDAQQRDPDHRQRLVAVGAVVSLRPRSIATPAAIMITANATSRTVPGMNRATRPPV